jgi:hypothetical protein
MKTMLRRSAVTGAVLGAMTLSGSVLAEPEVEQNHPLQSAQVLSGPGNLSVVTGGVTISGAINNPSTADVDFFSFYARKGDVLNFAIESKSSASGFFTPVITVLSGASPHGALDEDFKLPPDPSNPRIDKFVVDNDGIYVVAVSGYPCRVLTGGICWMPKPNSTISLGSYTFSITPAVPPALQVKIEVKPGSGALAPINPKSKGNLPVALISSDDFDALQVEVMPTSLKFGATGDEESLRKCDTKGVDVNGDGKLDMVCHFENELAEFTAGSLVGLLKGKLKSGQAVEGRGMLKVLTPKPEH